ncbi:hypothetical protein [Streptomyces beigongshangae]|uniref:hypothetical protein n=1 Tax=Streptomyces beigongshangae TaxID=2841597 RepID=UPI001C865344|nr:hypothetical protein [Streptomyces sp. REN17]
MTSLRSTNATPSAKSHRPHDADRALAYPEPPASPLWHRHGPKTRPITPEKQRRNCELLLLAQRTPRPRSPRPTDTPTETS